MSAFSLLHGQIAGNKSEVGRTPAETDLKTKGVCVCHIAAPSHDLPDISGFVRWTPSTWGEPSCRVPWRKYGNRQLVCTEIGPHLYNKVHIRPPPWRGFSHRSGKAGYQSCSRLLTQRRRRVIMCSEMFSRLFLFLFSFIFISPHMV